MKYCNWFVCENLDKGCAEMLSLLSVQLLMLNLSVSLRLRLRSRGRCEGDGREDAVGWLDWNLPLASSVEYCG